jgi:hypothetical protein
MMMMMMLMMIIIMIIVISVVVDRLCGLEVQVRFPALPDIVRSSGSGKGSTQPHDDNCAAISRKQLLRSRKTEINGREDSLR